MLTALGSAFFEWAVGEALGRGKHVLRGRPQAHDFDRILNDAIDPAAVVAAASRGQQEQLVRVLREYLISHPKVELSELTDPRTCIERWLAPLGNPGPDGIDYWESARLNEQLVVDALSEQVVRGIADNARRGGSLASVLDEQRYDALFARLENIAAQLARSTALKSSKAAREGLPAWVPARRGRNVSRPDAEKHLAQAVFAADGRPPLLLVWGTGGFGKTWLSQNLAASERALETFSGGVLWVQLSEDRSLNRVYAELEGAVRAFGDQSTAAGDPRQLARLVGELTEGRPTLIVVDDAWTEGHVEPFLEAMPPTAFRLITSRNQGVLPYGLPRVEVGAMREDESKELLRGHLRLSDDQLDPLLTFCAGWPLILALVGGQLQYVVNQGGTAMDAVRDVQRMIAKRGLRAFDHTRAAANASPRSRTVEATMDTSLQFLEERRPGAGDRFLDLAAFPEDKDIPLSVITKLWGSASGLDEWSSEVLLREFEELSLVQHVGFRPPAFRLHDVVRAYLRAAAGEERIAQVSGQILDLYQDEDDDLDYLLDEKDDDD